MNKIFKMMWPGVEVFWVLPYPIDFTQYNMCKRIISYTEGLTILNPEEKKRDMNNTYNVYLYFQKVEQIIEFLVGVDNIIKFRTHCEATLKPTMMSTARYMEKVRGVVYTLVECIQQD